MNNELENALAEAEAALEQLVRVLHNQGLTFEAGEANDLLARFNEIDGEIAEVVE